MTNFRVVQEEDKVPGVRLAAIAGIAVATVVLTTVISGAMGGTPARPAVTAPRPAVAPVQLGGVEQTLIERTERGIVRRREQLAALSHYSWVDRDAGVARIPIERAMEIRAKSP